LASSIYELLWVEKYRPRTLSEIINQEEVISRLKKFVESRNMPHLLFAGPAGTGKTTAAHALAHDLYGENYRQYMLELNASVSKDTPILVKINGKIRRLKFSDLDKIYFARRSEIITYGDGEYVRTPGLEVLTYDNEGGKITWRKASWLIKHKAEKILKVKIQNGEEISLTGNHSIIVFDEKGKLKEKSASQIKPGDYVISYLTTDQFSTSSLVNIETYESHGKTILLGTVSKLYSQYLNKNKEIMLEEGSLPSLPFLNFFIEVSRSIEIDWKSVLHDQVSRGVEIVPRVKVLKVLSNINIEQLNDKQRRYYKYLLKLALSGLRVLQVTSVEIIDYSDYVYDISVPNNGMFFAGEVPVLLHNSDERGINVIREKVKEFARSRTPPEIPFKIILLDEADNMTADAQQALRRLMELYSGNTRFILIANYPSKIIDPIQSRCAFFRFQPLKKDDVVARLKYIAENENVDYDFEALETIYEISEGDMRKAINILQAAAAIGKVTVESVYKVVGMAKPKEVREMLQLALKGDFNAARNLMRKLMIEYGLSGEDLVKQIHREILSSEMKIPEEARVLIADYIGEIHFRLVEGSDSDIQLSAFLAWLSMIGQRLGAEE